MTQQQQQEEQQQQQQEEKACLSGEKGFHVYNRVCVGYGAGGRWGDAGPNQRHRAAFVTVQQQQQHKNGSSNSSGVSGLTMPQRSNGQRHGKTGPPKQH